MPPPAPPSPAPAARPLSAWSLPGHTLRILGSCLLSLVLWFAAGQAVRSALMWAATEVAHGDHRQVRFGVVMFLFTLIVLTKLVVTVGMLHSVRGSLREIRARRAGDEADESLFGALDRSTLVFATIYIAWSFYAEDARELIALDAMKRIDQDFAGSFAGIKGEGGDLLIGLEVWLSAVVAVIAYLLKMLFAWWHTNGKGRRAASSPPSSSWPSPSTASTRYSSSSRRGRSGWTDGSRRPRSRAGWSMPTRRSPVGRRSGRPSRTCGRSSWTRWSSR
nr:hypothetical protein GCM10020093_085660 [Planobispora longispora]